MKWIFILFIFLSTEVFSKTSANAGGRRETAVQSTYSTEGSIAVNKKEDLNVRDFGLTGDPSVLIRQGQLDTIFTAAIRFNKTVYFPNGTYVFPARFTYDFKFSDCSIRGEDPKRTIITTKYNGNTDKIVERVDLTKPRPSADGFYRIDVISPHNHPDWSAIEGDSIDQYIKIVHGSVSNASFEEIKRAGYVTELDVTKRDPGIDGKYVVAVLHYRATGGGYSHTPLPYNKKVPILIGAYLQRKNGAWSRIDPANGFQISGNLSMENIQFNNVSFYVFTPYNNKIADQDHLRLVNCIFTQMSRVCALDREFVIGASGKPVKPWSDGGGFRRGDHFHLKDGKRLNYKNITISNCEFSYIHTSIFWEFPTARKLLIRKNYVHDCYTINEVFLYLPMANYVPIDDDDTGYDDRTETVYEDNLIERVRKYDPVASAATHIFRTNGNAVMRNNRIISCDGNTFYVSGSNTTVENNIIEPFVQNYAGIESLSWPPPTVFHIKGGLRGHNKAVNIINNKITRASNIIPFDIKNTNLPILVSGNTMKSFGYPKPLLPSDSVIDRSMLYRIYDIEAFHSLAGKEYYDRSITAGDYVYWDVRRTRWMRWASNQSRSLPLVLKAYDWPMTEKLILTDNIMYGYYLVDIRGGHINNIEASNNTIYLERGIFGASRSPFLYVDSLSLNKNTIIWGAMSPPVTDNNVRNLFVKDNTFYYNQLAGIFLTFSGRCDFIANDVLPSPQFMDAAVSSLLKGPTGNATVAIQFRGTGSSPELRISGGSMDAYLTRFGCAGWSGMHNVSIDGTKLDIRHLTDVNSMSATRRFAFYFNSGTATQDVSLSNLVLNFEERKERYLFASGKDAVNFSNLDISNITSSGSYPLNKMIYTGGGSKFSIAGNSSADTLSVFENLKLTSTINVNDRPGGYTFRLTGQGSYTIPAGSRVNMICIKSTDALPGFRIGSSPNGSQYASAAVGAKVEERFKVNINAGGGKTIYFSGITSGSADITIYEQ